jgi:hypothetical protein
MSGLIRFPANYASSRALPPRDENLALHRLRLLEFHLEHDRPLRVIAAEAEVPFRTVQRWAAQYRRSSTISTRTSLARLAADSFNPCTVVETSAGNFQAWLTHRRLSWNLRRADIGRVLRH